MGSLRVTVCTAVLAAAALTPTAYAADTAGAAERGDTGKAGSVSVTPATAAPGTDVALRVTGCAGRTALAASPAFVADARLTVADAARELTGDTRVRSTLAPGRYTVRVTCGEAERTGTFTVRKGTADGGSAVRAPAPGADGQPPAPAGQGRAPAGGAGEDHSEPVLAGRPASGTAGRPLDLESGTGGPPPVPGGDGRSAPPDPGHEDDEPGSAVHRPGAPASPVAPVRAGGGGAADLVAAQERGTGPGTAQGVTGLVLAGVAALVVALGGFRRSRGTG